MTRREETDDFLAHAWCRDMMNEPGWAPLSSRADDSNALFSKTLWTAETIRAHQSLYRGPSDEERAAGKSTGELRILLSLGSGLDGWPGVCHGGVMALVFDDTIHELTRKEMMGTTVTVSLKIDFRRPVRTPSVVLCRAHMSRPLSGRKAEAQATLEDGHGTVFAAAECVVVMLQGNL
ncbi:hypothetical protein RRF57_013187 [Xylaria bambusicola]|uniref:Thioesterase domain-containing protein n=1 Tax=Xylaria bambusicola TaxID=326684 RepID=A0AAN7ZBH1_9PEZI